MEKTKNQSTKVKEYTPQEFAKAYNGLVEEMGYQILSNPAFQIRDDRTWSVVMQTQIAKVQKQQV